MSSDDANGQHVITHVGSGKYSDVFRVRSPRRRGSVMMKVSYYRDSTLCDFLKRFQRGDLAGAARAKNQDSIMVSSAFARLTARLLDSVSPHFVVVYCDADCKNFAPRLDALLRERLRSLSPMQKRFNNLCFMEPFDSNLTKYLLRGRYAEAQLRAMVFQVLYTLAALQRLLPGFRHNDLSTNNVLVKRLGAAGLSASYTLPGGRGTFVVRRVPVLVALSDYDFLHVPNTRALSNERVTGGKYRVNGARNASYDTHFFLKSVGKCLAKRSPRAFGATRAFLRSLPLRAEDRQDTEIPGLDPLTVLGHAYFSPLRSTPATPGAAHYSF